METLESSSFCLDSTVLIDNLRGRKQTVEFIGKQESSGSNLATTTINSFELYYGAYRSTKRDKNLAATRLLLRRLTILELSDEASEEAGKILAMLDAKGEPVEFRDVLIGAIAKTHGTTLVTKDTEHFLRIPGLEVSQAP